jgi:protein involved in polysaccharide export with SLBB domain
MFKIPLLKGGLLVLFFIVFCTIGFSQDLLKGKDLSQIKVDAISASDFAKLKAQLSSSGMTPDQAEQMAIAKGLPISEAAKLKQRLNSNTTVLKAGAETNNLVRENANTETVDNVKETKVGSLINPLIFGSELYTNTALNFEPNLKLATPTNYILGPDDQIAVSVYGVQEYFGNLQISPEGSVSIPNVGEVKLAGLTIEAATQKLKTVMGNSVYSYLKSGGSKLSVTLSKIKTISITIIGSNRPGNYKISSFASVFNALFAAGGPSANGSFREIELLRNNKLVKKIDLYRFLVNGDQSDNLGLKDNDVIRIPVYKVRVEIQGQVKRPGIFEVLAGEPISKVLEYASGFTDTAYQASIKVFQRTEKERVVKDLLAIEYNKFQPKAGDVYIVSKTLNKFQNRVTISGAIFRPDTYELTSNLRVAELIKKADGLTQDAYTERGQIVRYQEDLTKSIISFDVKKALIGEEANNLILQKEDEVIISSVQDLKDKFKVTIQGEVRMPGVYDYLSKLTLKDLILQAGGLTDAALQSVEIARLIKRDSLQIGDQQSSELINFTLDGKSFGESNSNVKLMPFDLITIRRLPGYIPPVSVLISGQVQFPGSYALANSNERVSDLLKRAGGFIQGAYPEGAYLKRFKTENEKTQSLEIVKTLQKNVEDSSVSLKEEILKEYDKIPLDMVSILKNPGSYSDIFLKVNDELYIPKYNPQVKVSGEVLLSTQIPFNANQVYKDYINSAGGYSSNALKSKTYVVYANGRASATKHFLFFKKYPKIEPGSELIIPKKREKKSTSITEIAGFATVILSLVSTYVLLKK